MKNVRKVSFVVLFGVMSLLGESAVKFDAVEHKKQIEEWRATRITRLKSEDGWLTLIGLFWLQEGDNPFGSDPSNRIVFPKAKSPAKAGSLKLEKGTVRLEVQPGVQIITGGKPAQSMVLKSDASEEPTKLDLGSLRFFVIDRGGKLGVRVRDREHPARRTFTGTDSYPIDVKWRIEAKFEPHNKKIPILNILGMVEDTPSPGTLIFQIGGKMYRLDAVLEQGETDLFIIFGDQTNGKETYGAGRYVYTAPPGPDGKVILDFNKAYNPPCVFSNFATCPLPPPQNKLAVRIEAGEKKYVSAEHK
ncbi:DUF1684 domain-containing protein [bacterium]|nr:DUF1684 domain-containing protein [bacterium]